MIKKHMKTKSVKYLILREASLEISRDLFVSNKPGLLKSKMKFIVKLNTVKMKTHTHPHFRIMTIKA